MDNNHYIYFHINLVSNEVFYVGKGKDKRAWEKFGRNGYWKNTVNKYGYRVDIIHENLSEKRAFDWEKLYISMFGRKNLCNLTDGGEGSSGVIPNEETRKKMSDTHKGKNTWSKGKKLSEEHKEKLKGKVSPFKGKTHTEESRKKISDARKNKTPKVIKEKKSYLYNNELFDNKKEVYKKYYIDIPYGTFKWWDYTKKLNIQLV